MLNLPVSINRSTCIEMVMDCLPVIVSSLMVLSFVNGANSMGIHVSVGGMDIEECGTILLPCSTVKYAVESKNTSDAIIIHGDTHAAVFHESQIQVNRTLTFIGIGGTPTIKSKTVSLFIVLAYEMQRVQITLANINFEEEKTIKGYKHERPFISLKDSSLAVANCSFLSVAMPVFLSCDEICDLKMSNVTFLSPVIGIHVSGSGGIAINLIGTNFLGDQNKSEMAFKYGNPYATVLARYLDIRISYCKFSYFNPAVLLYTSAVFSNVSIKFSTFQSNNILERCTPGQASSSISVINFGMTPIKPKQVVKLLFFAYSCLFRDNFAAEGSGISIRSRQSRFDGIIENCIFENNRAWVTGGALSLLHENDQDSKLRVTSSNFMNNKVLRFSDTRGCSIIDSRTLGSGGAVSFGKLTRTAHYGVHVTVEKSTFTSNSAAIVGGAIYATSCKVTLQHLNISTPRQSPLSMIDAIAISITNAGLLYGVNIKVNDPYPQKSIVRIDGDALMDLHSSLTCPVGTIVTRTAVGKAGIYNFLSLYCSLCDIDKYNLRGGVLSRLRIDKSVCNACPAGAKCQNGIVKPINNYWGFIDKKNDNVSFIQLPVGYGCQMEQCTHYNSCAKYRSGALCSTCVKGYTENILSSKCIRNEDCSRYVFWTMAIFIVVFYLIFFIYKKDLMGFLVNQLLWYKNRGRTKHHSNNDDHYILMSIDREEHNQKCDVTIGTGLVKIFFYFYQIEALLDVYGGKKEHLTRVKSTVRNIFSFNLMINSQYSTCAMTDMSPVGKIIVRAAFICTVLVAFIILYIIGRAYKESNDRCCRDKPFTRTRDCFGERILAAFFEVFLLSYAVTTRIVISLLYCKQMRDQRVLYLQGDIECYQSWQYGLAAAGFAWIVPFWLYVSILPKLIREKRLETKGLFLGCIFPIPFIIYCLVISKVSPNRSGKWQHDINGEEGTNENDNSPRQEACGSAVEPGNEVGVIYSVRQILCAPFRDAVNSSNYLSWEGVYIFRRLFIVSVFVFVENPIYKLYVILAGQIVIFTHHVYIRPYKEKQLNLIETVSLGFLIMINAMNLLVVDDFANGIKEEGEQLLLLKIFAWVETVLHLLVPALILTAIFLLTIARCFYVIFKIVKYTSRMVMRNMTQEYS